MRKEGEKLLDYLRWILTVDDAMMTAPNDSCY